MDDNVIITSSQQTVASKAANVSLLKLGTVGQTILGIVVTSVVVIATAAVVVLIAIGVGYQPPVAKPDAITIHKTDTVSIFPLVNDKDPKGASLTLTRLYRPKYGTLTMSTDRKSVIYTPNGVYAGQDIFEYIVSNDKLSATSYVNITILNHVPECLDFNIAVSRNSKNNAYSLFELEQGGLSILDLDGDELFLESITQPSAGGSAHFDNKTLFYTPLFRATGTDTLVYVVTDKNDTCSGTITFELKNDAPVAQVDSYRVRKNHVYTFDILVNDYDLNGDPISITYLGYSRGNTLLNDNATLVEYWALPTTDPYYDSVEYQISDYEPLSSTSFATIEVYNMPPTAFNKTVTISKNTANNRIDLDYRDVDEFDVLTASIIREPQYGSGQLSVTKETKQVLYAGETWFSVDNNFYHLMYTPNKNSDKDDVVQFQVTDSYDTATAFVNIIVGNSPPVANDDHANCSRNHDVDINVVANDNDVDGDLIELVFSTTITTTNGGKVTRVSDKILRYTAPSQYVGIDSFTYTIRDVVQTPSKSLSASASVFINVYNEAPIAKDDSATVLKLKTVSIPVLSNDEDPNGDPLTITSVSAPSTGSSDIVINGRNVQFTADRTVGRVLFTYVISDDLGLTSTATVSVDVTNTAPVALNDIASTSWNRSITIAPLSNDVDADGDTLNIASFTSPTSGSVTQSSGSAFLYTPINGFVGVDSFTYYVTDSDTSSANPATITVYVNNTAPVTVADTASIHWRSPTGVTIDVLSNDSDSDGDALYVKSVSAASRGSSSIVTLSSGKLGVKYIPSNQLGIDSFTYVASDWNKNTPGTITVSVTNTKPVAIDDTYSMHWRSNNMTFNILSNDQDANSDPISISSTILNVSPSNIGSAIILSSSTGIVRFTATDLGTCSFTYSITDGAEVSVNPATVRITVTNANTPSTSPISRTIHWRTLDTDGFTEFFVYNTAKDSDGDVLSLSASNPTNGHVVVNSVQDSPSTLRFSNTESWKKGSSSFDYTLNDGKSQSSSTISVEVYNNVPVAGSISLEVEPDYLLSGIDIDAVAASSDDDPEDSSHVYLVDVYPSGSASGAATVVDGKIHYQPNVGSVGTDIFNFVISDGLDTATGVLTVTVNYVAVTAQDKFYTFHWRSIQSGVALNLTSTLPDNMNLESIKTNPPAGHSLTLQDTKMAFFTPIQKFIGQVKFEVYYTDGVTQDVISVTVTITNTAPTAQAKQVSGHWRTLLNSAYGGFDVLTGCSDINGDSIALVSTSMTKGSGSVSMSDRYVVYLAGSPVNGLAFVGSGIQFKYTITDSIQNSTALVDLTITNTPPVPIPQTYTVHWSDYSSGMLLDVAKDATDANNDPISLYSLGSVTPSSAVSSLTLQNGKALITGVPPSSLIDSSFNFVYSVSDGASIGQQTATIHIINTPPVANNLSPSVHWRGNASLVVTQASTDGDTISIVSFSSDQGSTSGRIVASGFTLAYTPPANFHGKEIVTYTISDGIQTTVGVANISVYNNAPITKDYTASGHWNTVTSFTFPALADALDSDDLDAGHLQILNQFDGLNGDLVALSNGVISVTPSDTSKTLGTLTITYYVTDGQAVSAGKLYILLTNTAPVASNKNITISRVYGQSTYILTGSNSLMVVPPQDSEGDSLTLGVISGGQKTSNFDVTVSIPEYFAATKNVEFIYNDGLANSNKAIAYVRFTNSPPVCQNSTITLAKGETKSVTVQCADANGDPISISAGTLPSGLTLATGGIFSFTAPTGTKVSYAIPFIGTDGVGATGSAYLNIRVSSQIPVANDYSWNILARRDTKDYSLNYLTASGANDPDGDVLSFSIVSHTCTNAQSISISGSTLSFSRPYTFSTGTCEIYVKSTDYDTDSITKTVFVNLTTSGLVGVGRSITVSKQEGAFFTMTESDIMINDYDPLGGTLVFTAFYVSSGDGCSSASPPSNGFCGNVSPYSPSAGTWRLSQASTDCQTQRFRYQFTSAQDPSQIAYAILDVRFTDCICKKPLDIVFVLDGSGSVTLTNFNLMTKFLKDIVAPLDIGSGNTQTQVGILVFNSGIASQFALSSSRTSVDQAISSLTYPRGNTNIRSAVLRAEQLLLAGRSGVPKMIITIFDGEPNTPCGCDECAVAPEIIQLAKCNSTRYPARTCAHCNADSPLKCNPCSDVLSETKRINARKPGNALGYWRVMSIGVGPYLSNPSAKELIRDLSYDQNLSLSVDWNQLSTVVSTIQSQSCDLVDTSTPSSLFQEGTDIFAYCGQIIGLATSTSYLWTSKASDSLQFTNNEFNPSDSRGNLFQITNCGAFGAKLALQSSASKTFSLWSLQTQKYVDGSNSLSASSSTPSTTTYYFASGTSFPNTNVPTWVYLTIQTSSSRSFYGTDQLTISKKSESPYYLLSVSYNDIAYRVGLPAASAFPTPITNTAQTGAN